MIVNFYVDLNVPNDKALIRHADRQYCNHGEVRTAIKSDYNGEWIGPFDQATAKLRERRT